MELERDERGEPATNRLNYTAYRLGRALDRFTENLALAHGVTLSQFLVLQVLGEGLPTPTPSWDAGPSSAPKPHTSWRTNSSNSDW